MLLFAGRTLSETEIKHSSYSVLLGCWNGFVVYITPCAVRRERRGSYFLHESFFVPVKLAKYDTLGAK